MAAKRSVEDFIVDFSQEEDSGGGGAHYKEGWYRMKILGAKTGVSENKGTKYLELALLFKEGKYGKGKKKMRERLYLTPKALRRFRLLLRALDMPVPKKLNLVKLAPKLKGKELMIEIGDEEPREGYEDRPPRSRVTFEGFRDLEFEPDEEDGEDEDLEDEDEDLEDEEDEDEEEDEEDEDEDEEDEEEEPPAKKRSSKSKATAKKSSSKKRRSKKDDEDEDDLDDLDLDDM